MDFELVYRQKGSTGLIEAAVLILLENGINKVYSKDRKEPTVMSILYIFSRERIANAIANLCNNDIISVDYRSKTMSYTSVFQRLLSISCGFSCDGRDGNENELIYDIKTKLDYVRQKEIHINFESP